MNIHSVNFIANLIVVLGIFCIGFSICIIIKALSLFFKEKELNADISTKDQLLLNLRSHFHKNGTRLFWGERLSEQGMGPVEQVNQDLVSLTNDGHLDHKIQVWCGYCDRDDECWQDSKEEFLKLRQFQCSECGSDVDPTEFTSEFFVLKK